MVKKIVLSIIVLYLASAYTFDLYEYHRIFLSELGTMCIGIVLGTLSNE